MQDTNITFSEIVKQEISHLQFDDQEAKYLLLSFFLNNGKIEYFDEQEKAYIIITYYLSNIRLIKNLFHQLKLNCELNIYESNVKNTRFKTKYLIKINDIKLINQFFNDFHYSIKKMSKKTQSAFFIGAFLSGGSLSFSKQKSNYHFEIRSHNFNYLENIRLILEKLNIKANLIEYRNQYKIYIKKSELISDILKLLKTNDALYQYEDFRIQRDFSNSLQRVNNLDVSNISKTIAASSQQMIWIQTIKNKHYYEQLDEKTKNFCELRMQNPEASLEELARLYFETYHVNILRTSLNHLIRKLKRIYLEIKAKEGLD